MAKVFYLALALVVFGAPLNTGNSGNSGNSGEGQSHPFTLQNIAAVVKQG